MNSIDRDIYLNRLIERRENGLIKVITGIRYSGFITWEKVIKHAPTVGVK